MSALLHPVISQISQVILGKQQQIKLTIACLLARGHLLIEDLPGVGKTTLAHAMARSLGLEFQRIQFTSDLLPADIVGVTVFDRESSTFSFHPGPVFSQVILADEVNRATPKAQSALLEAMEEHQVTVDGNTRALPEPFFVIATQNPSHQVGTFPLPESQLDRFLMRIHLGYPDAGAERELLEGRERRDMIDNLPPVISPEDFSSLQKQARTVVTAPALLDYLQAVLAFTRNSADYINGLSPRAGLYLLNAAKAWAFMDGRQKVIPEDLQAVLPSVVGHRLCPMNGYAALPGLDLTQRLIEEVAIP
ncbi:MAG: MoxR family ATPase [Betaproteobacteria bacterium]|jgi:MoxR-like ATPase|nr:MAG: MoxR family ATPase [Betaproteobacteria bacterium]